MPPFTRRLGCAFCLLLAVGGPLALREGPAQEKPRGPRRQTAVSIRGEQFFLNGRPTYQGRRWNGLKVEGLLLNSRMVQATFDDLNPDTAHLWRYPDTGRWDPERNTREFLAALPAWRRHGLLGITLNLQGGSPQGYSRQQPWHNSALREDGSLRADYLDRLRRVLDRADALGMVVILGLFYFGQDERLRDEAAVKRGTACGGGPSPGRPALSEPRWPLAQSASFSSPAALRTRCSPNRANASFSSHPTARRPRPSALPVPANGSSTTHALRRPSHHTSNGEDPTPSAAGHP
jgi:hypothetical protein